MRAFVTLLLVLMVTTGAAAAPESELYPRAASRTDSPMRSAFIDQTPQIIPGVQLGPVKLGMSAYDAAGLALAFERATSCQIDLLIVADYVRAACTRWGGCLHVSLPAASRQMASYTASFTLRWDSVMDGPASDFIAALGEPLQVGLRANRLALIWPQGLVAHVGGVHDGDGNVTYLAVVAPGSTTVPAIGYLRISLTSGFVEF